MTTAAFPSEETSQPADPLNPSKPERLTKPKLLLGEGREEVLFFARLLDHLGITEVQVEQYGGKSRLRDFLNTLPVRPGFSQVDSIGITRDADDNPDGAFQSICGSLEQAGIPRPIQAATFTQSSPRIGVYVFPDNTRRGMLEDLCLESVSADFAMACVDEFFGCVEKGGRRPGNMSKARVHAWLASQIRPDKRLGEFGGWPWDDAAFRPFGEFLRNL